MRLPYWLWAIYRAFRPPQPKDGNGQDTLSQEIQEQVSEIEESRAREGVERSQDGVCIVAEDVIDRVSGQL